MTQEQSLLVQFTVMELAENRLELCLKPDGSTSIRGGKPNPQLLDNLRILKPILVRHLRGGDSEAERVFPEGTEEVEALASSGAGWIGPAEKCARNVWKWKFVKSRLWWWPDGLFELEPRRD